MMRDDLPAAFSFAFLLLPFAFRYFVTVISRVVVL